jgi:hypothetical protein
VQESEIATSRDRSQSAKNRSQEMKMKMMNHIDTQMKKIIDTQINVKELSVKLKDVESPIIFH